jgi:2-polyprenyl-6-methoxyphenol hydroxylase-like FAD-dependent oxidoreductase
MMLGYLLARAGVPVTVLEKHQDFFRDFRGDTVHPSTLELFHELGLLEDFLKLPHQQLTSANAVIGGVTLRMADFTRLPTHCKFTALMPQWDFLNFLAAQAKQFSNFDLRMQHEAAGLIRDGERIAGVRVRTAGGGEAEIHADLVVGCDGRHSMTRTAAGFELIETGVPIDVLWFRVSRQGNDPEQLLGNINYGKMLVLINRGSYFQAGLIIRKGSFEQLQQRGLETFRQDIVQIVPFLAERIEELQSWDQINLLTVQINRLRRWHRDGLLCIGDAAHAMSPAGGVGINLAIQDAVAAANLLARALRAGPVSEELLARVQRRREFPVRVTQFLQVNAHRVLARVFRNPGPVDVPWPLKAVVQVPGMQHAAARVVGMGILPEHTPYAKPPTPTERRIVKGVALCSAVATGVAVFLSRTFTRRSQEQYA